ncbi:alkene reductase [Parachitinimonas caeni]|uniref:Alkene reductase n=1 Tax=Parachitinimonas caeni TaxID=3031301 RepID=A0ABT7E4P0_9NEIS|nr:alkene reductase [Parachitinimonas caeni]MDK2126400.1 alkene reductase [Parachitinimonas caeni]
MTTLFDPLTVGELKLPNRIIMAPLTRTRADAPSRVPNALMREYYRQRAGAGLIISEATAVSPMGVGYPRTPGIWSEAQVQGWKAITQAVHEAGGQIVLQLWHVGRISSPDYLGGRLPLAPSAIAAKGHVSLIRPLQNYVVPHALSRAEIAEVVEQFRLGAVNAQRAGFDGVELHGANGYLLDQFLQDGSNHRTDDYGGSLENRARLLLEATDAAISVWGPGRVGMHLAPQSDLLDMGDSDRPATFGYVARELGKRKIAFICARESQTANRLGPLLKREFGGIYIANEGLTSATASQLIAQGEADAAAFGKLFIANPDLPARLQAGAPLNAYDDKTFFSEGPIGYTDYPALADATAMAG